MPESGDIGRDLHPGGQPHTGNFPQSRIGLFGSQSRGDATPDSDLDFLVEFIKGRKNYDNYIELCFFLEDLFSKKIDLLTPESLSPHLKEQILREVQYETIH
ncbi:MAG: nucleotidyltransferase family protein [Desulfobacterales bacterium]